MNEIMTLGEYLKDNIEVSTSVGMFIATLIGAIGMYVLIITNIIPT